jgi:formamidopyrimidine-DNA glycosylase
VPELPEVEILARHLSRHLVSRRIESVALPRLRRVGPPDATAWNLSLTGTRVVSVTRRGKYLLVTTRRGRDVDGCNEGGFIIHLGMAGRVALLAGDAPPLKHAVAVFQLDAGRLVFSDARGFGRLLLGVAHDLGLGVEPLDAPRLPRSVAEAWAGSRSPIKPLLLDQSVIAGIGNIYASEALFVARIAPRRPARSLTQDEARRLWTAIRRVLREAVRLGGKLVLDFNAPSAGDGLFYFGAAENADSPVERFRVYDRAGAACNRCGASIRRSVMAGRATYECARCQR